MLTLLYIICDRSILLYVCVYMCINLYTVAFDNCFLKNKRGDEMTVID